MNDLREEIISRELDPRCENCEYWRQVKSPEGHGQCRINPPIIIPARSDTGSDNDAGYWPVTDELDWCKSFETAKACIDTINDDLDKVKGMDWARHLKDFQGGAISEISEIVNCASVAEAKDLEIISISDAIKHLCDGGRLQKVGDRYSKGPDWKSPSFMGWWS